MDECQALVDFYTDTNGDNWVNTGGWLVNTNVCTWSGVSCYQNHVGTIHLESNNLSGALSSSFGNFTKLRHLYLA